MERYAESELSLQESNKIQWKVLVLDSGSKKLVDNAVKEDDILHENITRQSLR